MKGKRKKDTLSQHQVGETLLGKMSVRMTNVQCIGGMDGQEMRTADALLLFAKIVQLADGSDVVIDVDDDCHDDEPDA